MKPTYDELLAFVTEVAGYNKDGDTVYCCSECNLTSDKPFEVCEQCGVADQCYEAEYIADGNDGEIDSYYGLISAARQMVGEGA